MIQQCFFFYITILSSSSLLGQTDKYNVQILDNSIENENLFSSWNVFDYECETNLMFIQFSQLIPIIDEYHKFNL